MALNIFAILFVLGITFMHSLFGLFSGVINVMCAITAAAVAFGFFEVVNDLLTKQGFHPSYTLPVSFVCLFFITHLVLRLAADNLIRGNVRLPRMMDVVGGAACGFVIAQITVGIAVLGLLMLPFGGRAMMFERYSRASDKKPPEGELIRFQRNNVGWFLRPDDFTVGLMSMLSSGSLSGDQALARVYPDFSEWVFWSGNTVQAESATSPFRDDEGDGWGDAGIEVVRWWKQEGSIPARYRWKLPTRLQPLDDPRAFQQLDYEADLGNKLLGLRVVLKPGVVDREADGEPYHRFRSTMFRLVGTEGGDPAQYVPQILGGVDPGTDELRVADMDNNFAIIGRGDVEVDLYFEVDQDFKPEFIEYRRYARAPVSRQPADSPPDVDLFLPDRGEGYQVTGASAFIAAVVERGTGASDQLPFTMSRSGLTSAASGDVGVEFDGGKFKSGRFAGTREQLQGAGPGSVSDIALPQGWQLFQLRFKARQALSLAGSVFDFVGSVTNQYRLRDDSGGEYPLSGYYAVVQRDGKEFIEFYLVGEVDAPAFRGALDFKNISNRELRAPDTEIGLLFFVQPGVTLKELDSGGGRVDFPSDRFRIPAR